jgi:hypothetical protein
VGKLVIAISSNRPGILPGNVPSQDRKGIRFMRRTPFLAGLLIAGLLTAPIALAQSVAETGRKLLDENKTAVVTVRVVIETQMSGPGFGSDRREATAEITGTIISPDGLIVTSLSQTDPASIMRGLGGRSPDFRIESTLTDIQVMFDDGSEHAAEEVLRDADLDLSFLRLIEAPEAPLHYINFDSGATAQLLDHAVVLNRLGRVASRTYSASIETIEAVVERPRTFYIPGRQDTRTGLGSPAFAVDGQALGLVLVRTISGASGGFQAAGRGDTMTPVILPGRDILEAAEQVPPREEADDEVDEVDEDDAEEQEDSDEESDEESEDAEDE